MSIQAKRKLKQMQKKQGHPSSVKTKSKDGKQQFQKKEPAKKWRRSLKLAKGFRISLQDQNANDGKDLSVRQSRLKNT